MDEKLVHLGGKANPKRLHPKGIRLKSNKLCSFTEKFCQDDKSSWAKWCSEMANFPWGSWPLMKPLSHIWLFYSSDSTASSSSDQKGGMSTIGKLLNSNSKVLLTTQLPWGIWPSPFFYLITFSLLLMTNSLANSDLNFANKKAECSVPVKWTIKSITVMNESTHYL